MKVFAAFVFCGAVIFAADYLSPWVALAIIIGGVPLLLLISLVRMSGQLSEQERQSEALGDWPTIIDLQETSERGDK